MKSTLVITMVAVAVAIITVVALTSFTNLSPFGITSVGNDPIPDPIADANNQFAIEFYKRAADDNDDNIFFSPISIHVAFSVLYEGAKENTAQQIQDVFEFELDETTRHELIAHTLSSLNRDDSSAILEMANALWIADWFNPYDSYTNIAKDAYLATAEPVDFIGDKTASVKKINDWVADKTYDKIDKVITVGDVNDKTAMIITNAIYFKGSWVDPFSTDETKESIFWRNSTDSVNTNFMNKKSMFNYTASDGAQILRLPYTGDRLSMMIILPNEREGISALEENISADLIKKWNHNVHSTEIQVSIPKFTFGTNYDLKALLKKMGITNAFNDELANLSGIAHVESGGNLFVSKAFHDAFVDVNEVGTEAAAVTTIVTARESGPKSFTADHPFLFLIQDDESGTILFFGKVMDPSV